LPSGTQLNVNTASPLVLQSLSDNLDILQAESLAAEAGEKGFEDLQSFEPLVDEDTFGTLALSTEFFRLTVRVTIGTYSFTMYSLLLRTNNGQIRPLTRSFGTI
jgi:general secretion pathway protein K